MSVRYAAAFRSTWHMNHCTRYGLSCNHTPVWKINLRRMWNFRFRQIGESVWFSFRQLNFFVAVGEWRSVSVNTTCKQSFQRVSFAFCVHRCSVASLLLVRILRVVDSPSEPLIFFVRHVIIYDVTQLNAAVKILCSKQWLNWLVYYVGTVFDLISEHALISGHPPFLYNKKKDILIFI